MLEPTYDHYVGSRMKGSPISCIFFRKPCGDSGPINAYLLLVTISVVK